MLNNLSMNNPVTLLLIGGLVVWAVARQVQARQVTPRSLVLVPVIALFFAVQQGSNLNDLGLTSWIFIALSAAAGLVLGVARGFTIRTWIAADGTAWMKGTALTMALWAALILFRVAASIVAHFAGVPTAAMIGEIMIMVALTFGAQNLVVWMRTLEAVPAR